MRVNIVAHIADKRGRGRRTGCSLRWGRCGGRTLRGSNSGRTAGRRSCRRATSSCRRSRSSPRPAAAPQTPADTRDQRPGLVFPQRHTPSGHTPSTLTRVEGKKQTAFPASLSEVQQFHLVVEYIITHSINILNIDDVVMWLHFTDRLG